MRYDARFDQLTVEAAEIDDFIKDRLVDVIAEGYDSTEYITLDELQEVFSMSRYEINKNLKAIGAEPFGELKNISDDGKRSRGVGKIVYMRAIVEELQEHLATDVDEDNIRAEALKILQGL